METVLLQTNVKSTALTVLAETMKKNTTTTTTMVINICRFDDHRPGFGLNRGGVEMKSGIEASAFASSASRAKTKPWGLLWVSYGVTTAMIPRTAPRGRT